MNRSGVIAGVLSVVVLAAGCGYGGINSVVLPGGVGTDADSYIVSAEFATASNLVPNSEVKVDDLTVGTVRSITRDGWHARVSIGLERSVVLPANVVAKVEQKSLLGASYVELAAPSAEPPTGRLVGGDVIPLSRTDKYPETEELLGALSVWLNHGGLDQVQTINTELNKALGGNEPQVRELLTNLATFTGTLDTQKAQLVGLIDAVDRLSVTLAARRDQIGTGIEKLGPGLAVLNQNRVALTDALAALDQFSVVGHRVITSSGDALLSNLRDLRPVLAKVHQAGTDLPDSLDILGSVLFPLSVARNTLKGEALSGSATVDLTRLPIMPNRSHPLPGLSLPKAVH